MVENITVVHGSILLHQPMLIKEPFFNNGPEHILLLEKTRIPLFIMNRK